MMRFKEYFQLKENNLNIREIEKYDWRFDLFKEKIFNGLAFELDDGSMEIIIPPNEKNSSFNKLITINDIPKKLNTKSGKIIKES